MGAPTRGSYGRRSADLPPPGWSRWFPYAGSVTAFADGRYPVPVRRSLLDAMRAAWDRLAGPGSALDGARRLELAGIARGAVAERRRPPWMQGGGPSDGAGRVAHEIGAGAQRVDRDWASARIADIGEATYVETVAITATVAAVDVFAEALGVAPEPFPTAVPGPPSGAIAHPTADIGAYVRVDAASRGANVGRSLTLVPDAARLFFGIEPAFYAAGEQFRTLVWDRALSRPQIELVAARTSALSECFY